MPLKIAIIGAGAVGWTRTLLRDLLGVPEFAGMHYALTDISAHNLDMAYQLCRRDVSENNLPTTITQSTDRRATVADADYVICAIRQGGLEAFKTDIEIPLKYGVDQCVGDTLCAGGIMYAQRTIPALLDFCKDIREVAKPGAWMLNYANPMAMNTWAASEYGGVCTIGLCHGVQGAHWQITRAIEHWARAKKIIGADETLDHKTDVQVVAAGLNHQTWFVKINFRGHDIVPLLPEIFDKARDFATTEKVRIDVLKRFGYYSTESNGHLSEYLPWYRKRTERINDWIDLGNWINGETGGYLRVCTEGRNWFETEFPEWLKEPPKAFDAKERSHERGSYILEALETGRIFRGHFNVPNRGAIPNLPADAIVEIPGYVDRNGINITQVGALPLGCAAVCSVSISVQRLAVEAAVRGDDQLLRQAMMMDPLVGAVCNPPEIWQMVDELLVAQAAWLPQYAGAIAAARARLDGGKKIATRQTEGAARLHTKTVDEMRLDRDAATKNAANPDKAKERPAQAAH